MRTVSYGPHPDQVVDLHLPAGPAPPAGWPVVVLLHGGFWRERYTRELMHPLAEDLARRGFAAANLEYRRVGGAGGWPATFEDVAAGIDHLGTQEATLDPDRLTVVGHSAGGHLALWATGRELLPPATPGGGPAARPCLAVGLAPVADLVAGAHLSDRAAHDLLGGGPAQVPGRYAVADPCRLVGHHVPVLLVHGESDEVVPIGLSRRYASAAEVAGDRVRVVTLPGDHFTVIDPSGPAWDEVVDALLVAC